MTHQPDRNPISPRPSKASFFVTCLVDQFRPQVGDAVVDVLGKLGVELDVPADQTCCGQPAFNSGYRAEAREVAARFLDIFDDTSDNPAPIVSPSGSCSAMVRNYYPILFRDDPAQLERVKRVADRLWEFSEFVVDGLGETSMGADAAEGNFTATYHRCCHALRELGVDSQPTTLLDSVDGLEIRPMERSEVCCGFGGAFSVKMPDISTAMLTEKLDNVQKTGASRLIAGDTGCIMHMEGGLRRRGSSVQVLHIAELLAESVRHGETASIPAVGGRAE
jgi:L-lactate dehydrogenase complex protein LldE